MKKITTNFVAISSALCVGFAFAGEMEVTNVSSNQFSGFFIGANLGAAWSKINAKTSVANIGTYFNNTTDPVQIATAGSQRTNASSLIGGGQFGFNLQLKKLVLGLEAGIDSLRIAKTRSNSGIFISSPTSSFIINSTTSTNYLFTLKPRIGFSIKELLVYAAGGLAMTNAHYSFQYSDNVLNNSTLESARASRKYGWIAGVGLEAKLSPSWSLRGEYMYVDFSNVSTSGVLYNNAYYATLGHLGTLNAQIATIGINYIFA